MGKILPPPGCLGAFRVSPAEAPELLLDTYTEWPNRFFAVACRCRREVFALSGRIVHHALLGQEVVSGPVTATCGACRRAALLFDPSRHGYDVEMKHFPPEAAPPGEAVGRFGCPGCGGSTFTLVARFEYPAALVEALESGRAAGYPSHVGREQELFTWFTLAGRCTSCRKVTTVASCECA